jgi:FPC/CPF motif-containing protein YcgG
MQKKTRSILEELDSIYADRYAERSERRYVIESRANNVIASAVRLLEQIEELYDVETAESLQKKLLNSIRLRDPKKFARSVKRVDENS